MELVSIASVLVSAPRAVTSAMDLVKRIRSRKDRDAEVEALAELVTQNAQAMEVLARDLPGNPGLHINGTSSTGALLVVL